VVNWRVLPDRLTLVLGVICRILLCVFSDLAVCYFRLSVFNTGQLIEVAVVCCIYVSNRKVAGSLSNCYRIRLIVPLSFHALPVYVAAERVVYFSLGRVTIASFTCRKADLMMFSFEQSTIDLLSVHRPVL